ncbi:MAG: segregation and condensation protein A [Chromatiales bacterium]|jgi:hypothetical protein
MSSDSSKEREVLKTMRKVLASIIRDTTPPHPGIKHPLSDATIEDVRMCLGLIAARERELADAAGIPEERPHYADEPQTASVVSFTSVRKQRPEKDD